MKGGHGCEKCVNTVVREIITGTLVNMKEPTNEKKDKWGIKCDIIQHNTADILQFYSVIKTIGFFMFYK